MRQAFATLQAAEQDINQKTCKILGTCPISDAC
jgi:hypothetical protein